jgi:hypothetical protein
MNKFETPLATACTPCRDGTLLEPGHLEQNARWHSSGNLAKERLFVGKTRGMTRQFIRNLFEIRTI